MMNIKRKDFLSFCVKHTLKSRAFTGITTSTNLFSTKQSMSLFNRSINKRFFSELNSSLSAEEIAENNIKLIKEVDSSKIRNIAIIAHVDHGKTTLVDCMLKQSGINIGLERTMDSNELEQERGITILSKCTSICYKGLKINIVDTPGHQDFGGEVERIMNMVDSVCLVVCASEGPMPQTRYVLKKALQRGLKPIVVINKADRDTARLKEVENEIFDLFITLDATDDQMEYPVLYASAKNGWATYEAPTKENPLDNKNIFPLLDTIIDKVESPKVETTGELKMLISQIESNLYFGKMLIGRINSGTVKVGQKVCAIDQDGKEIESTKVFKLVKKFGTQQIELNEAGAGDIVSLAGFSTATVTHTINEEAKNYVIPSIPIDPPMISLLLKPNDSPYHGRDGDKFTYLQIKERLLKEAENDVSLRIEFDNTRKDIIKVFGRGDLHLGILIEKLRREGFEMSLYPPQVIFQYDENKKKLEPIEFVTVEFDEPFMNVLIDLLMPRYGEIVTSKDIGHGKVKVEFEIPTRGMFGMRSRLINVTKGNIIIQSRLKGFEEFKGPIQRINKGALIAMFKGKCTAFALKDAENHGELYVQPGTEVYEGQVIGEMAKEGGEVELNPCREKVLTNVRTTSKDENIKLMPVKSFNIEECMSFLRGDELLEITPKNLRIRKKVLESNLRKKLRREGKLEVDEL